MYVEITKEAFDQLVSGDAINTNVEELEHCRKIYFIEYGVHLLAVTNYVEPVTQYYIRDINA